MNFRGEVQLLSAAPSFLDLKGGPRSSWLQVEDRQKPGDVERDFPDLRFIRKCISFRFSLNYCPSANPLRDRAAAMMGNGNDFQDFQRDDLLLRQLIVL